MERRLLTEFANNRPKSAKLIVRYVDDHGFWVNGVWVDNQIHKTGSGLDHFIYVDNFFNTVNIKDVDHVRWPGNYW